MLQMYLLVELAGRVVYKRTFTGSALEATQGQMRGFCIHISIKEVAFVEDRIKTCPQPESRVEWTGNGAVVHTVLPTIGRRTPTDTLSLQGYLTHPK